MENKKRTNIIFLLAIVIFIVAMVILVNTNSTKKRIITEITEIVTSHGLKDVVVTIDGTMAEYDSDYYKVYVDCSNMHELSIDQMFALDNSVRGVEDAFVYGFTSNGDTYEIFASSSHIYKNGEDLYNDYYNSESYKNASENVIPNSYSGTYDAKLKYGTGSVLICVSEDAMERYMSALNNGYQGTIDEMIANGEVAYTEKNTKCNIVEKKFAKAQVKLREGSYAGNTVWVVIESIQEE